LVVDVGEGRYIDALTCFGQGDRPIARRVARVKSLDPIVAAEGFGQFSDREVFGLDLLGFEKVLEFRYTFTRTERLI
jgi:hypothetical protein